MTGAAGQIAQGRFEVHVADRRRDEIGELSKKCSTCQGVPEAALEEIFVPFYPLDPSRNHETGGVGLGLAIVKACIESCRGAVRCRNLQPSGLEVEIQLSEAKL
jgi:signal transduction histidine kinase